MSAFNVFLRICTVAAAAVFVAAVVSAQVSCPFMACRGPAGDVWMLPFFLSVVGIPAVLFSVVFGVEWGWPKSPVVVVLGYVARASVVLPFVAAAVFGVVAGFRRH